MIHEKIEKLFPHIHTEFITYNLHEEGNMTPFLNFWVSDLMPIKELEEEFIRQGYEIEIEFSHPRQKVHNCSINPIFELQDDCSLVYANPDWSIEQMIDIIDTIVNRKHKKVDLKEIFNP